MVAIPITPEGTNRTDYWFIQVSGVEWLYILTQRILTRVKNVKPEEIPMFVVIINQAQVYAVKKEYVPIEVLIKYTGLSEQAIKEAEIIKLSVYDKPGLPKPTVDYWGEA